MGWFRKTPAGGDDVEPSYEDRLAQIAPGVPGRCPACGGLGYIDNIDLGHRYQIQRCKDCQHRWEYLFDDEGQVVGLTQLDADGRPVTRTRVRLDAPAPTLPAPAPPPAAPPVGEQDVVVDVRDEVVAATSVPDETEPTELSPAAWLRRPLPS